MKRVKWLADDRFVPPYGKCHKGEVTPPLGNNAADYFVRKGMAEEIERPQKARAKEINMKDGVEVKEK